MHILEFAQASQHGTAGQIDADPISVLIGRSKITSSGAGDTDEIREMLAFSAEHGIYPKVEITAPAYLNTALERRERNDARVSAKFHPCPWWGYISSCCAQERGELHIKRGKSPPAVAGLDTGAEQPQGATRRARASG